MGIVTLGPPSEIVLELAKLNSATVFVETGTLHGRTTRWASNYFESVFTIEKAESLYRLHNEELALLRGVKPLFGDSREVLPSVVAEIDERKAVFWLDGHWSGGETAGEDDECPLLEELACLSDRKQDIILIDDARLFLCAPPQPHKPSQWPGISDIVYALPSSNGRPHIQIIDDVIFAIPTEGPLKSALLRYAQERSNSFWNNFIALQRGNPQKSGLRAFLSTLKRRLRRG